MQTPFRFLALLLLFSSSVCAEIYVPPPNVCDPLKKGEGRWEIDKSLPFVYLEPHQGCFDQKAPIQMTLWVVNRSDKPLTVQWKDYFRALVLEAVGPEGRVLPLREPPRGGGATQIKSHAWSAYDIDLRE